jgi:glutamate synthase (ferredoxin)
VTKDGFVILGSETGVVEVDPANIEYKGRLEPGRMLLVDTDQGRIVADEEIKEQVAARKPYRIWLNRNLIKLADLPEPKYHKDYDFKTLINSQRASGYTVEDLGMLLEPMAEKGAEPIGSMGTDTPLAVLSEQPQLLYNYFKQLFAQVTNPPLDAIREELVTSMVTTIGEEQDLFGEGALHCHQLGIDQPILTNRDLQKIKEINVGCLRSKTLSAVYSVHGGRDTLSESLATLCKMASKAVKEGYNILILSDRFSDADRAGIPALLACSAVHHHLIREGTRTRCGIVVESAEPREVHHFALLLAYGAGAVNPYLAFETLEHIRREGRISRNVTQRKVERRYIKAIDKGIIKVMSKMGISTLQSYRGAQIFEAVGLNSDIIDKYFTWTSSRIGGGGLDVIADEVRIRHLQGYPQHKVPQTRELDIGGQYQWRRQGEYHLNDPMTIVRLQEAVRENNRAKDDQYSRLVNEHNQKLCTLRGMFELKTLDVPIPVDEVEPIESIVKRFCTGAMSFGSISFEAHVNLAIAMNRLGAKSNTGEGGEDPIRYMQFPSDRARREALEKISPWAARTLGNGDSMRSAIKQVASGRFGVTSEYLVNADELQIKMAQGAKPGEGGQLPGDKVDKWIGRTRHSTAGVGLISPPPHHDIYSIEDLAQLIHDLKNANRRARISVKLVSEVGVGTVAAGVAKGKADMVLISGHDGGTGASPLSSIKHAGLPWELGVAETHQTLVMNDLRDRIVLQTDGQLKTGRDVAIACLLGAEEFGFATTALLASGCVMMRKCHMNTCPVGIGTQDPELRKKFPGRPEDVVNFMLFVAQELREIMASMGFRTVNEMVGRADKLDVRNAVEHFKTRGLDFSRILYKPNVSDKIGVYCRRPQEHGIADSLDMTTILKLAAPAIEHGRKVHHILPIRNINRTVGTITGSEVTRKYGSKGLDEDTIHFKFLGSAGQSFAAFVPRGMTMEVEGDANDYFGKGLSGGKLIVYPPKNSTFTPEQNIIVGNVALYGATGGRAYVRGLAGERFCVRNSGVNAVVEGLGDHGCEYMTGGRVVVLGSTGRNFAAGMSGGVAYVLDQAADFGKHRCNLDMVDLEKVVQPDSVAELHELILDHVLYTGSEVGGNILDNWDYYLPKFVMVMPLDYRKVLDRADSRSAEVQDGELIEVSDG